MLHTYIYICIYATYIVYTCYQDPLLDWLREVCDNCVDQGVGLFLKAHVDELLSEIWRMRLKLLYGSFKLHTMDRELDNAHNKRRIEHANKWESIAARSINAQSRQLCLRMSWRIAWERTPRWGRSADRASRRAGYSCAIGCATRSFQVRYQSFLEMLR